MKNSKKQKRIAMAVDWRILSLAREKGISIEEAAKILRRAHILLEHKNDKIIWVRCVS